MKRPLFKIMVFVLAFIGIMIIQSCTDVTKSPYSVVTSQNFYKTDAEFLSALGAAYKRLHWWNDYNRAFSLQETTTDEMLAPTRGKDWGAGGKWRRLHKHTWNYSNPHFNWTWNYLYKGISTFNRLIYQFGKLGTDKSDKYIAELKGLRALYYWQLLDLFGNVPIVAKFKVPDDYAPTNKPRKKVYEFVVGQLKEIEDLLTKKVGGIAYGRFNYWSAKALLAKLYLNAEVYTGTSQWKKVLDACNAIINSGKFSLADDYYDNFDLNKGSPEFIFVIPYDNVYLSGFSYVRASLHPLNKKTYGLTYTPYNGFCTLKDFYLSYIDPVQNPGPQGKVWGTQATSTTQGLKRIQGTLDDRLNNFVVGPQYSSSGKRLLDQGAEPDDPNGKPLTLTPQIHGLHALRQDGARIGKWEIPQGAEPTMDNDFPVFRYANILLMKAEALLRLGRPNGEALNLVNKIRERAGVYDFTSLNAKKLLAERGREFFGELRRRTAMIRFGVYNEPFGFNSGDPDDHVNIFPIPRAQLEANPNLVQNPGYSGQ